ncbi:unnamed protein product [Arctia plantaginis]|uniref:[histone H3]-lysine(36) N-trimethyltransferase n=1 Tax=Arctia plantaginis TaxID=874455 RepID=A0A8S1AZ18_ARCPL|nr:unnamed protein product [Arctia plantaginis]
MVVCCYTDLLLWRRERKQQQNKHQLPTESKSNQNDPENVPNEEASTPAPPSSETSELTKSSLVPVVALHKKFGKYRCLLNNDETFTKKYDLGSDSETNSSVEIRVVDPCASSESDSNATLETQLDNTSIRPHLSPVYNTINTHSQLRNISPLRVVTDEVPSCNKIPLNRSNETKEYKSLSLEIVDLTETDSKASSTEQMLSTSEQTFVVEDSTSNNKPDATDVQNIPFETEQLEFGGDDDDDDEVITVVQIVEDDNPELYYNIKIDSPKANLVEQHTIEESENTSKNHDFQSHFEKLNLTSDDPRSPMDCSDSIDLETTSCGTPDLQFTKENLNDGITRPDPSITPSSTLSDDSNSSRVTEHNQNNSNDSAESSPTGVRRSNRIKTISNLKQKTKGYGLVKTPLKKALITQTKLKLEEIGSDSQDKSLESLPSTMPNSPSFPVPSEMPVKVKSRWRRSSELEMGANSPANSPLASPSLPQQRLPTVAESFSLPEEEPIPLSKEAYEKIIEERMNQYQHLDENEYMCERMISKETKKMTCDCFMTKEELERGELACGEDCLNRLLMIECNSRCPVGDRCTNRRFQKRENGPLRVFYADKKGCGVEASEDIPPGEFLMEYVGEVLDYEQFYKRAQAYSDDNNLHHYFMSLKGDTVIDATLKGNISRFINHSCDPIAETQKWTVNGELRIGFFSKREIKAGEEITFDYQFQRFGKVAQRCYCGASNCRGWIGGEPDSEDEDDEEEDEDVSTSKTGLTESTEESLATPNDPPRPRLRRPKKDRAYKPKAPDLVQDADIEEDLEALGRTGVKNQSHTLRLSRTVVRAKTRRAQCSLLRLLRDADLPCRRLFLDYRGLRLLAPWCTDAPLDFKLEMLLTVDRLPIPNKTMVQESRFFTIVERWLSAADQPQDNVFIDEATGLPVELPNTGNPEDVPGSEKAKDTVSVLEKIKDLSKQLLERWSSLKEVFKIPKKERIQQMKEHERQANVERRAADSSGSRDRDRERREERERRDERERDREREKDRERERDRDRERDRERDRADRDRDRYREREKDKDRDRDKDDRDRRKRRSSPEGRRSIRLSERVLAAVPPMSKEERRRAFAEAAAAADESRRQRARDPPPWPYWHQHDAFQQQMFPGSMVGGVVCGVPGLVPEMPPDWMPPHPGHPEFQTPPFCPPFPGAQPFCMPQPNLMGMSGFSMGGFMFGQQVPGGPSFPPHAQPQPAQPSSEAAQPAPASRAQEAKKVVLPSLWRSAEDERGRTYYYHVKLRQPQWLPPPAPPDGEDSSSDDEEEQVNAGLDSPLIRRQTKGKVVEGVNGIYEVIKDETHNGLIPDHALVNMKPRKRRPGLVSERPISPRTEEDKLAGRLEVKRYKQTKEKLRRRREKLIQKVRLLAASKQRKIKGSVLDLKQMVELVDSETDSEDDSVEELPVEKPGSSSPPVDPEPEAEPEAFEPENAISNDERDRKIKELFRSTMARVMVQHLNPYRSSSAPAARITSTADFKHLARKLTHFVMLKELKHCRSVEELVVTDSVRSKAKMFVKKYMAKFGPVYKRPPEEAD